MIRFYYDENGIIVIRSGRKDTCLGVTNATSALRSSRKNLRIMCTQTNSRSLAGIPLIRIGENRHLKPQGKLCWQNSVLVKTTFCISTCQKYRVKWVPVTTAWRVLRLRMEERPPIWRVAANKLNKQSRTDDEGWSSSLGVGRDANNPPRENPC
jgi:hypothetical protein